LCEATATVSVAVSVLCTLNTTT